MDGNDESSSNKKELSDFIETLDLPHQIKLEENVKNSFINATIHCLTNIRIFLDRIYSLESFNDYHSIFFDITKSLTTESSISLRADHKKFVGFILSDITFIDKSNHDSRILIDFILNRFLKIYNIDYEKEINEILNILKNPQNHISQLNSFSENIFNFKMPDDKNNYKIILKKSKKCPNEGCKKVSYYYKSISTLHFKLDYNEDKIYTLNECFDNFLKNEKKENEFCSYCKKNYDNMETKILFNNLPNIIIIFIYYGNEKNDYQKFYYKFDEILDFSKMNVTVDEIKENKYFLSSVIACKYPKDKEKELFYTFCRKDIGSKYIVYNNNYINDKIHHINNKIIKLKDEELDKKRGFPYVLVYTYLEN